MPLIYFIGENDMIKNLDEFIKKLLFFFPETNEKYLKSIKEYKEILPIIIIEDIFIPEIINLLKNDKNISLLENIFNYFEKVSNSNDSYLKNIFEITILESLGNDKEILNKARKYMGPVTSQLQLNADIGLGRK